jgi:heat shock transcription factor
MVNDPKNNDYIRWMPDGESFEVLGTEKFEKEVLPRYYKHSKFSSFVRQLNMYGWHKVQDVNSGAMQGGEETWRFRSPYFILGREDLLDNIVRNKGSKGSDDEEEVDISQLMGDINIIKTNQLAIGDDLMRIKKDNDFLWNENLKSREQHQKHTETLERILRFLASLYGSSSQGKMLSDIINPSRGQRLLLDSPEPKASSISNQISEIKPTISGPDLINSILDMNNSPSSRISSISTPDSPSRSSIKTIDTNTLNGAIGIADPKNLALSIPENKLSSYDPLGSTPDPDSLFPELQTYNSDNGNDLSLEHRLIRRKTEIDQLQRRLEAQKNSIDSVVEALSPIPAYARALDDAGFNVNDFIDSDKFMDDPVPDLTLDVADIPSKRPKLN